MRSGASIAQVANMMAEVVVVVIICIQMGVRRKANRSRIAWQFNLRSSVGTVFGWSECTSRAGRDCTVEDARIA